jgi:succinate dehydrogenase hydrophobic anchor subunit
MTETRKTNPSVSAKIWRTQIIPGLLLVIAAIVFIFFIHTAGTLRIRVFNEKVKPKLEAVELVVNLVVQHLHKTGGEWPKSWTDLESVQLQHQSTLYVWPDDVEKVKKHVSIDFSANSSELAKQSIYEFEAIWPREGFYKDNRRVILFPVLQALRKIYKAKRRR